MEAPRCINSFKRLTAASWRPANTRTAAFWPRNSPRRPLSAAIAGQGAVERVIVDLREERYAADKRCALDHLQHGRGCRPRVSPGRPGIARVYVGHGWLIFALPPSEVAVHPAEDSSPSLAGPDDPTTPGPVKRDG